MTSSRYISNFADSSGTESWLDARACSWTAIGIREAGWGGRLPREGLPVLAAALARGDSGLYYDRRV